MNLKEKFLKIINESEAKTEEVKPDVLVQGDHGKADTFAAKVDHGKADEQNTDNTGLEDFDVKTDEEYFNEVDPKTGARYVIPNLNPLFPNYRSEYVHYMKLKQVNPRQFEKILNWE
jgi:pyruvate/2-oxoglutarate dehydrogenase complex dihydrolipoamide dehydrogenase (E3) component